MLNSEQTMFALNDIKDEHLESARAMLGYQTGKGKRWIGKKRIIAFSNGPLLAVMLNPEIISRSGEYETEEGCLSLEGKRKAKRYASITVTWYDTKMKKHTGTLDGFAAQVVQHETDHCNGVLI